jgi:enoyl-CoA hydratase
MGKSVRVEKSGAVTTVILDRPESCNAVDRAAADALADAFVAFEEDAAACVAVLWGAGGNFSTGLDLHAMAQGRGNRLAFPAKHPDPLSRDAPMGPTRMRLSKPVIAAVSGQATGGGLELALWCDLRIAEEDAVFGAFNRRWGLPMMDGGTVRLPRLIGESRALDIILTGRPVGAREALAMGLTTRVVASDTARAEAESVAQAMTALPQASLIGDRSSVYEQFDHSFTSAMENEFVCGMKALASGEGRRGAALFDAGASRGQDFCRTDKLPGIK